MSVDPLIEVKDLKVHFHTEDGVARAVDGVGFSIAPERTLGVVGESGCGKSVTARAVMGLIEAPGKIEQGEILLRHNGRTVDIAKLDPRGAEIRGIRGTEIAMIFQEPMTSLNPVFRIGDQIVEAILLHEKIGRAAARERAVELLAAVGIPLPRQRFEQFPHQLSGGMRQRAMIAMAMSCNPKLLIADEPTTALDVTIQAQVMDLMNALRRDFNTAIMFITHDLGVIAGMADDVVVMYLGRIVESGPVREIFRNPKHPYTQGLMGSIPSLADWGVRRLTAIDGVVPSPFAVPQGCGFAPRCPHAMEICRTRSPDLAEVAPGHAAACFLNQVPT
ncbi:MAG: ABC transporter ATP-binding protein [Rhodospirillaceae bacterium]|nr:ABC transporter ATP-binding protein [Rhodospirillaceae bacterium]